MNSLSFHLVQRTPVRSVAELENETGERFEVLQVKEKFGTLRFYVSHHTGAIDGRIAAALEEGRTTGLCESRCTPEFPR